jgi:hypothetical protein
MEILVNVLIVTVSCADKIINETYAQWKHEFKKSFVASRIHGVKACEHQDSKEKCNLMCFWKDHSCREKPFLMIIGDVLKVFCGEATIEQDDVDYIFESVAEIYKAWFQIDVPQFPTRCQQIFDMFKTIEHSILQHLKENINWSQTKGLLHISDEVWRDLWFGNFESRRRAIESLDGLEEDEDYKKIMLNFLRLIIALKK